MNKGFSRALGESCREHNAITKRNLQLKHGVRQGLEFTRDWVIAFLLTLSAVWPVPSAARKHTVPYRLGLSRIRVLKGLRVFSMSSTLTKVEFKTKVLASVKVKFSFKFPVGVCWAEKNKHVQADSVQRVFPVT